MTPSRPVLIAGAGIGGLALARALDRVGIACQIFERAPVLHEVGSGLGLMMNAVRALERIGVAERVREIGAPFEVVEFASFTGRSLRRTPMRDVAPATAESSFIMHRADLHGALLEGLADDVVATDAECVGFEADADGVVLDLRSGERVRGRVLVGADGLHSVVRRRLHGPEPLRYSGQTCYRGVAPTPPPVPGVLREVHGPGRRVGICPLHGERVYWWAAINAPEEGEDDPLRRRERVLEEFAGWPFHFPEMVRRTPADAVLRNDLVDRGPRARWGRGRVTLLGDAAHPMLPNLGQGACTAIEDAVVLARALAVHDDAPAALRAYEKARHRRASAIIRDSWLFGIPVRWQHRRAVRFRERALRMTPRRLLLRRLGWYMRYDPGPLPVSAPAR